MKVDTKLKQYLVNKIILFVNLKTVLKTMSSKNNYKPLSI